MDFTSQSDKAGWVTFHRPKYKCQNGHEGEIKLTIFSAGKEVAGGCGICLGNWLAKTFPVELVE